MSFNGDDFTDMINYCKDSNNIHENAKFDMGSYNDEIISFIVKHDLFDIICQTLNKINEIFNSLNLELSLEEKFGDEKWIVITIFTDIGGEIASDKLNQLEDMFIDDKFLDNILLSVEFE